jgi:hypothetical protein
LRCRSSQLHVTTAITQALHADEARNMTRISAMSSRTALDCKTKSSANAADFADLGQGLTSWLKHRVMLASFCCDAVGDMPFVVSSD